MALLALLANVVFKTLHVPMAIHPIVARIKVIGCSSELCQEVGNLTLRLWMAFWDGWRGLSWRLLSMARSIVNSWANLLGKGLLFGEGLAPGLLIGYILFSKDLLNVT